MIRFLSSFAALAAAALIACAAIISTEVVIAAWKDWSPEAARPVIDDLRPARIDQLTATSVNDRCVGGMRCHGSIVPLRATMLVG